MRDRLHCHPRASQGWIVGFALLHRHWATHPTGCHPVKLMYDKSSKGIGKRGAVGPCGILSETDRMTPHGDYDVFEAGDVVLQSGSVFPSLRLAYKTYGALSPSRDNVIVYPTSFSAQHTDTEWLVQRGGTLNPDRFFIVIPNLFGNGLSSSPSNSSGTLGDAPFPSISYHDAVAIQRRLLTEQFGISKIALVYGWSMGGMQAYHWAACHPDMVERAAIVCGSARCSPYNHVFLEGVKAALTVDPAYRDGRFVAKPSAGL